MDCFIIRVYRRIARGKSQPDEIAGLVERVGRQDNGRPFSGYDSLLSILRDEYVSDEPVGGSGEADDGAVSTMRLAPAREHN